MLVLVKNNNFNIPVLSESLLQAQQEFHNLFEVPVNDNTRELYNRLIEEEHEEWLEEYFKRPNIAHQELKELADLLYVTCGFAYQHGVKLTQADISRFSKKTKFDEAITDFVCDVIAGTWNTDTLNSLIFCMHVYAAQMGWDLDKAYRRVHQSNLSKLGPNNKPIRREDGKVLKGPNYQPPDLTDLTNETENRSA